MQATLDKMLEWLRRNAAIAYVGVGMALYRCLHEWAVWLAQGIASIERIVPGVDAYLIADAGKVLGAGALLVSLYFGATSIQTGAGRTKVRRTGHPSGHGRNTNSAAHQSPCVPPVGWPQILTSLILLAGVVLLLAGDATDSAGLGCSAALAVSGLIASGMGAGMLFLLWIELCGRLAPLSALEALALSYLVRSLLLPYLTGVNSFLGGAAAAMLSVTVFLQLFACSRVLDENGAAGVGSRSLPARGARAGWGVLLAWACAFTFAFGLGQGSTQLAHSVGASGTGYIIVSVLVLVLTGILKDRFDRNALVALAVPLMFAALFGISTLNLGPVLAQVLTSAGMCAFELLVYTKACEYATQGRMSAMLPAGCVRIAGLAFADAAVVATYMTDGLGVAVLACLAMLATLALCFAAFLPRFADQFTSARINNSENDASGQQESKAGSASDEPAGKMPDSHALAINAGLSPREEAVFRLLCEGHSAAQISETLFISNGAVRAHCSRIYDKFGVHSRKELDALLDESR